jgi:hypothetical protein
LFENDASTAVSIVLVGAIIIMNCIACGSQLPEGARACPQCGTFISDDNDLNLSTISSPGIGPTIAATPSPVPSQQPPPATGYGVNPLDPYHAPPPQYNPYSMPGGMQPYGSSPEYAPPPPSFEYRIPTQPAPTLPAGVQSQWPQQQKQGKSIAMIVGIVALVVILGGGGILLALNHSLSGTGLQSTPTARATTTTKATATTQAQATPNPNQDPYGTFGGTLVASDPMHDNSKGYKWDEVTLNSDTGQSKATCGFANNAYHVGATGSEFVICNPEAPALTLSNVVFEANLTIVKGNEAGLNVRVDQAKRTNYVFFIDTNGNYELGLGNLNNIATPFQALRQGKNAAIKTGLNQSNLVALAASSNTLSAYVNGQFVASVQDSTYSSGQLGLYGDGGPLDVAVSNVRVWKL